LRSVWLAAIVLGALAVATGLLPAHDALSLTRSVAPVLAFLLGITVLAELADRAGVFSAAARLAARAGRGSTRRLFLLMAALAALTTVFLSLDTTAVLLTPVVLTLADDAALDPLPFALLAVWLANTASLLLPVSNLTNLLAIGRLHLSSTAFATHLGAPEAVAVVVPVLLLWARFRGSLAGTYRLAPARPPTDRTLFVVGCLACAVIGPAVLAGVTPWQVALPAAGALAAVTAWRDREAIRAHLVPWRLILLVEGLFLVVSAAGRHGLDHLLADAAGHGVLRSAAVGAAASNAVNNLPAYLALARVAHGQLQLFGVLLGTNVGPLITVYGSLATLLWRERCAARGLRIGAGQFARLGALLVPALVVATWGALVLTA
jgi:arsenical pump membrane protein